MHHTLMYNTRNQVKPQLGIPTKATGCHLGKAQAQIWRRTLKVSMQLLKLCDLTSAGDAAAGTLNLHLHVVASPPPTPAVAAMPACCIPGLQLPAVLHSK